MFHVPAHKQVEPAKAPGQSVSPLTPSLRRYKGSLGEMIDRIQRNDAIDHAKAVNLFHAAGRRLVKESEVA